MQEVITRPKIKLPQIKSPEEILKIWEKARGIWRKKRIDPLKYLRKTRKEWERSF